MLRHRIASLTLIGITLAAAPHVSAAILYATNSSGSLLQFDSSTPGLVTSVGISGLQPAEALLGIDFRPATGVLYGLGNTGQVYTLNQTTGAATAVGAPNALSGAGFGFDFNPMPDRIRVTSDADQNLRLNPITGGLAATDTPLAFAVGDVNFGANPNIVGSGYTNSFAGTATTTLYGIDSVRGILVTQAPPNDGKLNTVGSLGVTTTGNVGFDILFLSSANLGFAALQGPGGFSSLYSIDLQGGGARLVGAIGTNQVITGLAAAPVPEPGTAALAAGAIATLVALRRRKA